MRGISMFTRRAKRNKGLPRPVIRDPLAVIPLRPDNVKMKRDSRGMVHLRLYPELKGLRKKVADLMAYDYTRKVELDEYGTLFYGMVDGDNKLKDIVECMISDSEKDRKEVEEGVILFTKKLMTMDMLVLKVPEGEAEN